MHELLDKVHQLRLPVGDFAIFGSGPLLVRGIIDHVGDIDILCRGDAWSAASSIGELVYLDEYDVEIISIDDGLITFGRSWGYGDFDVDELIDSAEEKTVFLLSCCSMWSSTSELPIARRIWRTLN